MQECKKLIGAFPFVRLCIPAFVHFERSQPAVRF
jgi:hypothetical protein